MSQELPFRTLKADGKIVVIAAERVLIESALRELIAADFEPLSEIAQMGREWAVTVRDPADNSQSCVVTAIGSRSMITGPSAHSVGMRQHQLVRDGARFVSGPAKTEDKWIAVVDNIEGVHRW